MAENTKQETLGPETQTVDLGDRTLALHWRVFQGTRFLALTEVIPIVKGKDLAGFKPNYDKKGAVRMSFRSKDAVVEFCKSLVRGVDAMGG